MKTADDQYKQGFYDELLAFRERVQTRAKQKVDDAVKQYEEVKLLINTLKKYIR
jgi:cell division cycle protein 37